MLKIFVNLPVADVGRSRAFYEALGFTINEAFSGESSACVVMSDTIYAMVMEPDDFAAFTDLPVADARTATAAMYALSADRRDEVDALLARAVAAGGTAARPPRDLGFMYSADVRDPDGHHWEFFWMDPVAAEQGPPS
ncbi:VOC family protein [Microcella daejeonensis]|uniref:VOC family protein n=2 Tax=Microcella daejeonensis TaxID=2994971 RepID=A0A9E8ML80_9MICO|nr:VOC family protein [Microcella daejeonensis]WAB81670.1 VOC family protein [Microcella daejeonensis]